MRQTTGNTLLEEARMLALLLKNSPESVLSHHADDIRSYFLLLHTRAEITHSVSRVVKEKRIPHPDELLPGGAADLARSVVRSRRLLAEYLGEIVQRRVKLSVLPEP